MRPSHRPTPVAQTLAALPLPAGVRDRTAPSRLRAGWADLVGEALARHTWPGALRGDVLVVGCDGVAWRKAVEALGDVLVARIGEREPSLRVRRVRAETRLVGAAPAPRPPPPPTPAPEQARRLATWLASVQDVPRRERLLRILLRARAAAPDDGG
ncbi:DUF721 domain-containing protein [Myxococcota bacterium]|nr:DUF721 domain-containing protein [Myxococcota bacterium]